MASTNHPLLLAAAITHGVLSLGHTVKGLEMFKHVSLNQVPAVLRATFKIGWYEGSGFFLMLSILNYKWSQTGIVDGADKAIAAIITAIAVGAGASYFKSGDKGTGVTLTLAGILQGIAAKNASS